MRQQGAFLRKQRAPGQRHHAKGPPMVDWWQQFSSCRQVSLLRRSYRWLVPRRCHAAITRRPVPGRRRTLSTRRQFPVRRRTSLMRRLSPDFRASRVALMRRLFPGRRRVSLMWRLFPGRRRVSLMWRLFPPDTAMRRRRGDSFAPHTVDRWLSSPSACDGTKHCWKFSRLRHVPFMRRT